MFSREDLECLDPGYFEIIYMDDRDVTIMSRNTRHMWYIHNPEYPLMGSCIIFHKHKVSHPYHQHGRSDTLRQAVRSIKSHDKWQLGGRLVDFPKQGQSSKRLTYRDKYSEYGFSLQRQKEFQEKNGFQAKRFYFLNFYPALQEYVHRLFAFGKLPFDINDTSKKEPDYLDRTWLMHGRCCREVTRMDCVQLINALDVCEFMFNKPEERKEFELICV